MEQTLAPPKPKKRKLGPSFWVAFHKSAGGTAKREVTNKKTGETWTQVGWWYVHYRDKYGKTITDGTGGHKTKPLARAAMAEFRKKIGEDSVQEVERREADSDRTVISKLVEEFLPIKIASLNCEGTSRHYKDKLPKLVKYLEHVGLAEMKISEFTGQNAWGFKDWLISKGHNNGGVRGHIIDVKCFFFWAKDRGFYATANPFSLNNSSNQSILSKAILPNTHEPRYLTEEEIQILFEANRMTEQSKNGKLVVVDYQWAGDSTYKQNIVKMRQEFSEIISVALFTGMREGEIVNLKREWVYGHPQTSQPPHIVIPKRDGNFRPKGRRARSIPVSVDIWPILSKKDSGYYWTGWNGKPWTEGRIRNAFPKLLQRARDHFGFKGDMSFHDLRHTCAKLYLQAGGDMKDLMDMLGHRNLATTQVYSQWVNRKAQAEVINRIKINTSPILKIVN